VTAANYTPPPPRDRVAEAPAELVVPPDMAGLRLDLALARLLPQHSRNRLKAWIDAGDVTVDGAARAPRHRLAGGERLRIAAPPVEADTAHAAEAIPLAIVHEDDAIIVVDKPAGLVVHPGAGNRGGTLQNALLHHAPELAHVARAGIVHRLDKDTSGLLVVARTPEAQTALTRALAARDVHRDYLAIAWGDIDRAMTVDAPIARHPAARTTMAVVEGGRAARTHVAPRERYAIATLVQCTLETGRTHQIRVHLAAIRHPLIGDATYGRARDVPGLPPMRRQALHAWRLALAHPSSGAPMRWQSQPPADFVALQRALAARHLADPRLRARDD
jgi:23S rRNA pseudouridine1911/1915/1917 synthase